MHDVTRRWSRWRDEGIVILSVTALAIGCFIVSQLPHHRFDDAVVGLVPTGAILLTMLLRGPWGRVAVRSTTLGIVAVTVFLLGSISAVACNSQFLALAYAATAGALTPAPARTGLRSLVLLLPYAVTVLGPFFGLGNPTDELPGALFLPIYQLVGLGGSIVLVGACLIGRSRRALFARMGVHAITATPPDPPPLESLASPATNTQSSTPPLLPCTTERYSAESPPDLSADGQQCRSIATQVAHRCQQIRLVQVVILIAGYVLAIANATAVTGSFPLGVPIKTFLLALALPLAVLATALVPSTFLFLLRWSKRRWELAGPTTRSRNLALIVTALTLLAPIAAWELGMPAKSLLGPRDYEGAPGALWTLLLALATSLAARFSLRSWVVASMPSEPLNLLILRVFRPGAEAERRMNDLFGLLHRGWNSYGTSSLICGPDWLGTDLGVSFLFGAIDGYVAQGSSDVDDATAKFCRQPRWPVLAGAPVYPTNSVLCAGRIWRYAVHRLMDEADIVLMDLRELDPNSNGCAHELDELARSMPTSRFLLLVDDEHDVQLIRQTLAGSWQQRADRGPDAAIRIYSMRQHGNQLGTSLGRKRDQDHLLTWIWNAAARSTRTVSGAAPPLPAARQSPRRRRSGSRSS